MVRPIRIEFPGAVYHVTSRGNERKPIFREDRDRHLFLDVVERCVERWRWVCHAYCLMGNHYHLLVETPEPNLSRGMRQINGEYTQAFNRRYDRCGHLFQGRFKCVLVEKESHLLELCRYVVLNPVRAKGIGIQSPMDWPWSSFRATAGVAPRPRFLTIDWVLGRFGGEGRAAREAYERFVTAGAGGEGTKGPEVKKGLWVGTDAFVEALKPHLDGRAGGHDFRKVERTAGRPTLAEFFPPDAGQDKCARDAGIGRAYFEGRYSQGEIARHLGLHPVTVGRIAREYQRKL